MISTKRQHKDWIIYVEEKSQQYNFFYGFFLLENFHVYRHHQMLQYFVLCTIQLCTIYYLYIGKSFLWVELYILSIKCIRNCVHPNFFTIWRHSALHPQAELSVCSYPRNRKRKIMILGSRSVCCILHSSSSPLALEKEKQKMEKYYYTCNYIMNTTMLFTSSINGIL